MTKKFPPVDPLGPENIEASQIATLRKARGMTQASLAERMGVNVTTVFRWEAGTVLPSLPSLNLLGEILSGYREEISPLDQLVLSQEVPIAIVRRDAVLIGVNRQFASLLGAHQDDIVGVAIDQVIPSLVASSLTEYGLPVDTMLRKRTKRFELYTGDAFSKDGRSLHRFDLVAVRGFIARHTHEIRSS